ncbi:MAG TPA: HPr family phosphocarrier protein [Mycobacteriales bacterium]|nr:HPr family phosphocarrier protein [Mycobacteriales bacterium]
MTLTSPVRREVTVTTDAGLHARPAADFAATAGRFAADVHVTKDDREVDGKSVLLLLTLDVRRGDAVVIEAIGPDADPALDALCRLVT